MRTRLEERPRQGQLTVPYMVDATRSPIDFKVLDLRAVERCAKHRRCGICGGKVRGRLAFIGPVQRLEASCFGDPWMHPDCAELAMSQCPFLGGRRDYRDPIGREDPALQRYREGMRLFTAADGRAHRDRLGAWHFEAIGELVEVAR